MITSVSQVSRTYRTQALWYFDEDAWKQEGRQPGPSSPKAPVTAVSYRDEFAQYARTTAQGVASVLTTAHHLKHTGDKLLSGSASSVLESRIAESSRPQAVEAKARPGAAIRTYSVQADKIAAGQINSGAILQLNEPTVMAAGSNQMKLVQGEQSVPLSVYILQSDTNQQALQKVRGAINHTGLNVHASLLQDDNQGTVQLELSSIGTGSRQAFTLSDVFGNAAATTGIGTVSQAAQDAVYRIDNGHSLTSDSNELVLDQGNVSVTLKEAASEPVILMVGPDTQRIKREVQELIDRYNALHAALNGSAALLANGTAGEVKSRLSGLPLDQLGIQQNPDGSLKLNAGALEQQAAADLTKLLRHLRGAGGLATALTGAADYLLTRPAEQLLDKKQAALFQSFTNYRIEAWDGNEVQTYLPLPLTGLLLNSYS
ncbi:MAG: hypothetical protein K0S39_5918 [Paenibacillus sp.]|jgi:flagellar capping protein FliD|nr:hypothetical protein [Paenibacillus sp.]